MTSAVGSAATPAATASTSAASPVASAAAGPSGRCRARPAPLAAGPRWWRVGLAPAGRAHPADRQRQEAGQPDQGEDGAQHPHQARHRQHVDEQPAVGERDPQRPGPLELGVRGAHGRGTAAEHDRDQVRQRAEQHLGAEPGRERHGEAVQPGRRPRPTTAPTRRPRRARSGMRRARPQRRARTSVGYDAGGFAARGGDERAPDHDQPAEVAQHPRGGEEGEPGQRAPAAVTTTAPSEHAEGHAGRRVRPRRRSGCAASSATASPASRRRSAPSSRAR